MIVADLVATARREHEQVRMLGKETRHQEQLAQRDALIAGEGRSHFKRMLYFLSLAPDDELPELESSLAIACSNARSGQVRSQEPATTEDMSGQDLPMPELQEAQNGEIIKLQTRLSEAQEIQSQLRTGAFLLCSFATS